MTCRNGEVSQTTHRIYNDVDVIELRHRLANVSYETRGKQSSQLLCPWYVFNGTTTRDNLDKSIRNPCFRMGKTVVGVAPALDGFNRVLHSLVDFEFFAKFFIVHIDIATVEAIEMVVDELRGIRLEEYTGGIVSRIRFHHTQEGSIDCRGGWNKRQLAERVREGCVTWQKGEVAWRVCGEGGGIQNQVLGESDRCISGDPVHARLGIEVTTCPDKERWRL